MGLATWNSTHRPQPGCTTAEGLPSSHRGAQGMAPFSRMISQLPGGRLITLGHFHQVLAGLFPYWNRHCGFRFTFPICNASVRTSIYWQHDSPMIIVFLLSISSDQETNFTAKVLQQCPLGSWNSLFPQHTEAAGLIEWWHGLLNTQLECWVDGSIFQVWGQVLQKTAYALNQCPTYDVVSLSQNSWVLELRVEIEMASSLSP